MNKKPNRLSKEKSPYLLQHAYNPVNWYPWGKEAFDAAVENNKPVFLSIGYSTCHWCHVMEKESFEDDVIAELMNETFINIKVDREERPDIDGIYMTVCNILTGSGGWPLTIILTPDKKPFFAGTYFPKTGRFGRIGMKELVPKLKEAWINQHDEIIKSSDEITSALKVESTAPFEEIDKIIFEKSYDDFLKNYDQSFGGFGRSPKFPSPHNLQYLLRYYSRNKDNFALGMVENTLLKMRMGGIYDHLGFGFHRYSTDRRWKVPHFEKMLYDQASISSALIETFQASGRGIFKKTAEEIFEYVLRDMTSPEGVFYSAEDADSEGDEGRFYLWTKEELYSLLDENGYSFVSSVFSIEDAGNWTDPVSREENGTNILHITHDSEAGIMLSRNYHEYFTPGFEELRKKLFRIREKRVHPFKDDKILTDWNAFMISSFAKGGAVFNNSEYLNAAEASMRFLLDKMVTGEGTLLHRYRCGEASIHGSLDDYAFLIQALLDLYEAAFNPDYLLYAISFTAKTIELFYDSGSGGFFFTPSGGEELIARRKEIYDGAIPSGNSVMMLNLLRLGRFTGNSAYDEKAWETIRAFAHVIKKSPISFSYALAALDFAINKSYEIVVAAGKDRSSADAIIREINNKFIPGKVILLRTATGNEKLVKAAPFINDQKPVENKTTVYVCSDFTCSRPVYTVEEVLKLVE